MPDEINELDVTEAGLKAVMGHRFHDHTEEAVVWQKERKTAAKPEKVEQKPTQNAVEAQWEPVKERTWVDNLKDCVKWAALFGGLSLLIFFWKETGLMADSIAVPSMCVCTALAGWGIGKNATRRNR